LPGFKPVSPVGVAKVPRANRQILGCLDILWRKTTMIDRHDFANTQLELTAEFGKYVFDHPEVDEQLPEGPMFTLRWLRNLNSTNIVVLWQGENVRRAARRLC
jgi:hypothetical protein